LVLGRAQQALAGSALAARVPTDDALPAGSFGSGLRKWKVFRRSFLWVTVKRCAVLVYDRFHRDPESTATQDAAIASR